MSKVWFITGANRGLGLDMVKAALAAGDRVVATARDAGKMAAALGENDRLLITPLDVTDAAQAEAAVQAALQRFGQIDVLVNNAGYGHFGPFEEASVGDVEQQFAVNLFGAMHVTRAVLPAMRAQRSGRIFNISSIAGVQGFASCSLYCGSKYALEGWSESLAHELKPLGIQVTAVEPGFFRTDFLTPTQVRYTELKFPEYAQSMDEVKTWLEGKNQTQEGDPVKLAQVLVDLTRREEQPLHLLMGSDAVKLMEGRIARDTKDVEEWRAVSCSTDFPAA